MPNAIGTNEIGKSFADELAAPGLAGVRMTWGSDGTFSFADSVSAEDRAAVLAVFAAHNPRVAALKAYAAAARFVKETAGVTVNSVRVATDRESQATITGAALMAQVAPNFATQWKGENGAFVTLAAAEIVAMAQAVAAHVAACFAVEASVVAAIVASPAQITTEAEIDAAFSALNG